MPPTETHAAEPGIAAEVGPPAPSVSSALERLLAASQSVVTKRIDLALLEVQEIVSRGVAGAVLAGLSALCVAAAWFALTLCVVLLLAPDASLVERLGLFAILNTVAAGLTAFVLRRRRLQVTMQPSTEHQA